MLPMFNGFLPIFNFVCESFALGDKLSLDELVRILVIAEELIKQPEGTNDHPLVAGLSSRGSQGGRNRGRGGRNSGDGRSRSGRD